MSVNAVLAPNSHGNLDEQIAQLMQCKPLSEQEVCTSLAFFDSWCPFMFESVWISADRGWYVCLRSGRIFGADQERFLI